MKNTDDIIAKLKAAASLLNVGNGAQDPAELLHVLPSVIGGGRDDPLRMLVRGVSSDGGADGLLLSGRAEPGCRVRTASSGCAYVLRKVRCVSDQPGATCRIWTELHMPAPGEVLGDADHPVLRSDLLSVDLLWMGERPLYMGREYRLHAPAGERGATVIRLKGRLAAGCGLPIAARKLEPGEVGHVELALDAPLVHDGSSPETPLSWIMLIDPVDGAPAGLGRIRFAPRRAHNVRWQDLPVDKAQRAAAMGQWPFVLWFTGLSGSGKSTLAGLVERKLHRMGRKTYLLDGDNVRHGLCADLGFTQADRIENMRRIVEVTKLMVDAGLIVLVSFISPFRSEREKARRAFEDGEFVEVHVATPLEVCERRDPKGLYARARAGEIPNFTGISSPYEPPESPEIRISGTETPELMAESVIDWLRERGLLDPFTPGKAAPPEATDPGKGHET